MSNSTDEYWSLTGVDGQEVSLHMWGWAVTTVGGNRYDLPPRRGSDITLAYRPGQVHRRKLPDARPMSLVMFMVGFDPATGHAPPDQRLQWNDNWDALRRLVYRHSMLNDQRVKLTRRWFLTAPDFPVSRTGDEVIQGDPGVPTPGKRLVTAFAWAEMTGTMDPSMTGRFRSDFQLDFTLADPYFYGYTVTATMTPGDTAYVWNDGHDVAINYVQVDLVGPLVHPKITNLSSDPDSWVQFNGTVLAGETVRLVIDRFTCEKVITGGTNINEIGHITSFGPWWVNLLPGANKLALDAISGTGTATITFRPPYV